MKITILHHDLEPNEKKLKELFEAKGFTCDLMDVRKADFYELKKSDLILNRVYASVANRDYKSIDATLKLLNKLKKQGIKCLNSYQTSVYDYSKYDSFKIMSKHKINTPKTLFLGNYKELSKFLKKTKKTFEFPVIIKRNTGGRGKDIAKADSEEELEKILKEKIKLANKEKYNGGFIAQEFINSSREYDCRIGIIDGKFAFSYSRSLISTKNDQKPWLASVSNGSKEGRYDAHEEEIKLALKATKAIGAEFNEMDVMFTKDGPCIIENNPTPNYFVDEEEDRKRVEFFVNKIIQKYLKK